MKRVNRREFAKMIGGAALVTPLALNARGEPLASSLAWPTPLSGPAQEAAKKPAPQAKPTEAAPAPPAEAKPEPKPKLTPEQEEAVRKAVERRDRQLAAMRSRVLPYDLEPAFVFDVRRRPRAPKL